MSNKRPRRYNGVYMVSFRPPDSRIRRNQYFPGTRAASKALGHRVDLLRRGFLKNRNGCNRGMAGLDGFVFITAQLAYELDWKYFDPQRYQHLPPSERPRIVYPSKFNLDYQI